MANPVGRPQRPAPVGRPRWPGPLVSLGGQRPLVGHGGRARWSASMANSRWSALPARIAAAVRRCRVRQFRWPCRAIDNTVVSTRRETRWKAAKSAKSAGRAIALTPGRAAAYLSAPYGWARSSAVEHSLHTREVTGSIPVAPTIRDPRVVRLVTRLFGPITRRAGMPVARGRDGNLGLQAAPA